MARVDEIARLETLDNGKPIFESRYIDVPAAAECFHYYAGWADKMHGETIPVERAVLQLHAARAGRRGGGDHPVELPAAHGGVEGGAGARLRQHGRAEARRADAAHALALGELRARGGLARRRAQRRPGHGLDRGRARSCDTRAWTRSRSPGRPRSASEIMRGARRHAEEGARSSSAASRPNIVFADADLDAAVRGAATGIFYGKGEVCAAGSRLLVERSIHDEFVEQARRRARRRSTPGDPLDPKTRLGAHGVARRSSNACCGYVDAAGSEGATLVAGGARADVGTARATSCSRPCSPT